MSDSIIPSFIVSHNGKDANVDVILRDGQRFYNATKLNQTFGTGRESEKVPQFLLNDSTRAFILQKYIELKGALENVKEIKDLLVITDSNDYNSEAIRTYLSSTNKKSLPDEILESFVLTKRGRGAATYLSEALFIDYAMQLSPQIKSVVIEVFRKYGWVEFVPQEKKADVLLSMSLQEEMKNVSEQYPTRGHADTDQTKNLVDENTSNLDRDEDALFIARFEESPKIKSMNRLKDKLTTQLIKDLLLQVIRNEKRVFETKEAEQTYVSRYYSILFDTIYLALFGHRAQEMRDLVEQEAGTPRDSMTLTCLFAIHSAEANIERELYHLVRTRKVLTKNMLMDLVIQCCEQPASDLFKYSKEIDFLVRDKKIKKDNQVKQIDVTMNEAHETKVKTNIVALPKNEGPKKIVSKNQKHANDEQLSLFDENES